MVKKDKRSNTDIPGNAVGSAIEYQRQLVRWAEALLRIEQTFDHLADEDSFIVSIRINLPKDDHPEYLAVVKSDGYAGQQVAFHQAESFLQCLVGVANRLINRSLKFKEDEYGGSSG